MKGVKDQDGWHWPLASVHSHFFLAGKRLCEQGAHLEPFPYQNPDRPECARCEKKLKQLRA